MWCSSEAPLSVWERPVTEEQEGKNRSELPTQSPPLHWVWEDSQSLDFPGGDTSALGTVLETHPPKLYEDALEKQLLFPSELALKD